MNTPFSVSAHYEPQVSSPRVAEALVVVLDTHAPSDDVFQQLKQAASRLATTRLIYNVGKDDLISVVRSGTDVTKNDLNKQKNGGYDGIHVVIPPATRSILAVKALAHSKRGVKTSNLLNILDVCGFYLSLTAAKRARNNHIILLTAGGCVYRRLEQEDINDFKQQCILFRDDQIKVDIIYHCSAQCAEQISELESHFSTIGDDIPVQQIIDHCQSNELALLFLITKLTKGNLLTYDEALPLIDKPTPKAKKASAKFRGVLNIADVVKIPVKRYSHVYAAKHPTGRKLSWNASKTENEPVPVLTETQRVASANDDAPLQSEDIIHTYPYGPELVPQSNEIDKYAWHMQLERGLDVIGFVPQHSVPSKLFLSAVDVILPMAGSEPAERLMQSLVFALAAEKMGILARSVATERGAPTLAYLWPRIEVDQETGLLERCFLFIVNIPMKEDIRHFPFASLDDVYKRDIKKDAVDTMDRFISSALVDVDEDAMGDSDDEDDPIWPPELCNPNLDWFHTCIIHRALAGVEGTDFPPLAQWHREIMDPMHFLKHSNKEEFEKALGDLSKVLPLIPAPPKKKKFKPVHQAIAGDDAALREYLPKDETEQQQGADEEDAEQEGADVGFNRESMHDMDEVASQITDLGVEDVSEQRPESDFAILVKRGQFRFASLSLIVIIRRFIREEKDFDKAIRCIKVLKEAGIANKQPQVFNNFISDLVNRCSEDNSNGKKTKAFFNQLGIRGQAKTVDVIPFMENPKESSPSPAQLGLKRHLEQLSFKVKELTSQGKQEPSLSAIGSAEW